MAGRKDATYQGRIVLGSLLKNIQNPEKQFFEAFCCSCSLYMMSIIKEENGLMYARKAMIISGSALNTNGCWEERQLLPKVQK